MDSVPPLNRRRSVFVRALATTFAIVIIVFALTAGFGSPSLVPSVVFEGKIIGIIISFMPLTAELIVASFILASLAALALTLSSSRAFTRVVSCVTTGLQSIPIFLLAFVLQIVLGLRLGWVEGGTCSDPCTLGGHLQYLALPAITLALYLLPAVVALFGRHGVVAEVARAKVASTLGDLGVLFAARLPDLVSAAIVVELMYAWRGEGRLLILLHMAYNADKGGFIAFLLLNALVLLLVRVLAALVLRRDLGGAEASE